MMQTIPSDIPDAAGHAYILGSMSVNLGEISVAQGHLQAALEANPLLGQAMLSLAASEKMSVGNEIGDQIVAAEMSMATAPVLEQAHYQYGLGKVLFDRKNCDGAFSAFAKGAAQVAATRPYDRAEDVQNSKACKAGYSREVISDIVSQITVQTSRPIFVTGLPRSGTTLIEQILVSHSTVAGGEELGKLPIVERDIGGPGSDLLVQSVERQSANALAELYLHLASERFGGSSHFVDKSLNASRHMGIIASILPEAPIVWLRRNPLDCAWSAFRTYFLRGLDWSWNLETIAKHFILEDELHAHWASLLGDRILTIQYEDFVTDPEVGIRRLLAHCRLSEEPAVFSPHKTKRAVTTASVVQVRQPINKSAIDAAGPYRKHLQPFIDAYQSGN